MKYLNCTSCGKEKITYNQQVSRLCQKCGHKGINSGLKRRPQSEAHRSKASLARGGTGVVGEISRLDRYPGLDAWKKRNKEKTPYCQWCYSEDSLQAHHIMPKAKFLQYSIDDDNCRIMCKSCHQICHKQGGY